MGAFSSCSSLQSVRISSGVIEIGERAFSYCESLQSIEVSQDNECFMSQGNCLLLASSPLRYQAV